MFSVVIAAVVRKKSRWSPWYQVRNSSSPYELRLRCACRTRLADETDAIVCSPNILTETRQCATTDCVDVQQTTPVVTSLTSARQPPCPKCQVDAKRGEELSNDVEKRNSFVDKEFLSDQSQSTGDSKYLGVGRAILTGFCYCRDLGPLRVCRRCPFTGHSRATEVQRKHSDVLDTAQ